MLLLYAGPLALDAPLTDPDEGLHAGIVQEMSEHGEIVRPRFLGQSFLDKPILFFWLQLASVSVFGMNTAAIRLPGLLLALLGVLTTGWLARTFFRVREGTGHPIAWLAAACYATMAIPFALAQAPVHDVALVPLVNTAILAFWQLTRVVVGPGSPSGRSGWPLVVLAGVALGLSVLTKGLPGVAIVGVSLCITVIATRTLTWRLVGYAAAALVVAAAVAAPWYAAMEARQPGYLQYYFVSRHLLGFATDSQQHGGQPWWYHLPIVAAGGLPWILYIWRRPDAAPDSRHAAILLWSWLGGGLLLLSFASSKLVTYVLPVFPPIAILCASQWADALATAQRGLDWVRRRAAIHALALGLLTAAAPWGTAWMGSEPGLRDWVVFGAASAGWLYLSYRIRFTGVASAWLWLVSATAVTFALALVMFGPPIARAHSAADLSDHLNASTTLPGRVLVVRERIGSVVFYLRPDLRSSLDDASVRSISAADAAVMAKPGDVVAARPADSERVGRFLPGWTRHLTRGGQYVVFTAPGSAPPP